MTMTINDDYDDDDDDEASVDDVFMPQLHLISFFPLLALSMALI